MSLLFFRSKKPKIWPAGLGVGKPIEFDASIREEHALRFAITSSPIEANALVSDHIQELPEEITVDFVISKYPDEIVPNVQATRHIRLHQRIKDLARLKQPFDVVTSLAIYANMVFREVRAPRSNATTHTLVITASMRKIEIATVDVAEAMARAAQEIALGEQDIGAAATAAEAGL